MGGRHSDAATPFREAAFQFRALFAGTWSKWEPCGCVRRCRAPEPGEHQLHLVEARPAAAGVHHPNAVWARAQELLLAHRVEPVTGGGGVAFGPDDEALMVALAVNGTVHEVHLGTRESWGPKLAWLTGPPGYWDCLLWRLKDEGTLTMHRGVVCSIDRSDGVAPRLDPIACPDERTFFRLARTSYKDPPWRYGRVNGAKRDWPRGMLPPWYPPGVVVYADPSRQPWLFDRGKEVRRRWF